MYVCICHGVTTDEIQSVVAALPEATQGDRCVATIKAETGAGTCCGACLPALIRLCEAGATPSN